MEYMKNDQHIIYSVENDKENIAIKRCFIISGFSFYS